MTDAIDWLKWVSEVQAIAQAGLTYCENPFDKERYKRLQNMIAEFAAYSSNHNLEEAKNIFQLEKGYATPKMDVRSLILQDDKVLLVRERSDGLWTLPGGWADVNESPSEAAIRETKEETGYDVTAIKLLALWDKLKHEHPQQWPHAYKCIFHCQIISGEPTENIEISEQGFFNIESLPELSTPRITKNQILRLYQMIKQPQDTLFD